MCSTPDVQCQRRLHSNVLPKMSRCIHPKVLNANIREGFCQKLDENDCCLQQNLVDIACITETWLNPLIPSSLTDIDGYVTYRDDGRQGGGVAIFVKEGLLCRLLDLPNVHQFDTLWLLYRHPRMPRELSHVLLGCVYFSQVQVLAK